MAKVQFLSEEDLVFSQLSTHKSFINLIGEKYNRLTVIGFAGVDDKKKTRWFCKCDCGNILSVKAGPLRYGHTSSCGCVQKEGLVKRITKHGHAAISVGHTTYDIWKGILYRTKDSSKIKNYSERGIKVCDRWLSYRNFLDDMGVRPSKLHSIDREDNNGNYEPGNCRWVLRKVQNNNTRSNRLIEVNGEVKTLAQWADSTGLEYDTIRGRLDRGWSPERAVTSPLLFTKKQ